MVPYGADLSSEGDGPQRDDEEQVGNVCLDAFPVQYLTLTWAEEKNAISARQLWKS